MCKPNANGRSERIMCLCEPNTILFLQKLWRAMSAWSKWSDIEAKKKSKWIPCVVLCRVLGGWVVPRRVCVNTFIRFEISMHLKCSTKNKLLGCLNWKFIARALLNFFFAPATQLANVAFTTLEFLAFVVRCWNKCWVLLFKRNRYCFGRLLPIQFEQMPEKRARARPRECEKKTKTRSRTHK